MENYNWPYVLEALQFQLEQLKRDEPEAVNDINALETVIAGMPDEAYA